MKDYDATSPGCLKCHADSQMNRVQAHLPFAIAFGSGTHDTVCLHCHDTARTDRTFAGDFSTFDCLTCHARPATDSAHQGLASYSYASAACNCHPNGSGGAPPNHTPDFFPIGAGTKHEGVGCTQCHTDLSQAANPANFACAGCHGGLSGFATAHGASGSVGGVAILTVHSSRANGTAVPLTSPN